MTYLLQRTDEPGGTDASGAARHGHRQRRSGFRARLTDHVALAVGTTQGLFMVSDGMPDGPFFKGSHVPAFLQLGNRYYVATIDPLVGPTLRTSDDGGESWSDLGATPIGLPADFGEQLVQICQLQADYSAPAAASDVPGVFAGVEPAALFRSSDGIRFELVRGLWDHPDRPRWKAGGGGLVLHTVLTHRDRRGRITVAIANGGIYRSDDDGDTWHPRISGMAEPRGHEGSQARLPGVHKLAFDAAGPDTLFAQTDTGIYRTENAGDSWVRVGRSGEAGGVASDFGFPVVGHPVEPGTAFVFPLESEEYPCSPGGRPRVYRTTDGGARWGALGTGLPHQNAHVTVLGDAFTVGDGAPYPLAFGTKAGELFASLDQGDNWRLIASELPPVLCVRVLE
jgi:hypothetical protein